MDQKKLKVLFIAKNVPVKGIHFSRIVIDIAHKISAFCNVTFLYPNEKVPPGFQYINKYKPFYKLSNWDFEGFHISVANYIRFPFRKMAFWFWKKLSPDDIQFYDQTGPYYLIHAHYLFPDGYLAYLYGLKYNVPYIITIRNADIKHLKNIGRNNPDFLKAKRIVSGAQKVLSLNLSYKLFIDDLFEIDSFIIPHGIEETAFLEDTKRPDKTVTIATVSEAIKRKNLDWIIRAVKNYSGNLMIKLNIIGSGLLIKELKQLAGDDKRINFRGKIDRDSVLKNLQDSDIFVLPSYNETFGLVYLEAAATHNAIIGLRDEGVWGIFEENSEMLFCSDEDSFQEILYHLVENESLRIELKKNALKKVKQLSWENITNQYQKVYAEAIESFVENSDR